MSDTTDLRDECAKLEEIAEVMEFYMGSEEVARPGDHQTVRINYEDFTAMYRKLTAAFAKLRAQNGGQHGQ